MLTKPTGPFASDGEIASRMEEWGDSLAARVAELERDNKILTSQRDEYREAVSTLDVQGVTGMVEDWVCVPSVEWFQVFDRLNLF